MEIIQISAFDHYLLAVPSSKDRKSESSRFDGKFDLEALRKAGRLLDVSWCPSYIDYEAVLSIEEFPKFIDVPAGSPLEKWYNDLSKNFGCIIVCVEEWESGLGD